MRKVSLILHQLKFFFLIKRNSGRHVFSVIPLNPNFSGENFYFWSSNSIINFKKPEKIAEFFSRHKSSEIHAYIRFVIIKDKKIFLEKNNGFVKINW
jgi:hypothetical protein